jgi:hypothetical protein
MITYAYRRHASQCGSRLFRYDHDILWTAAKEAVPEMLEHLKPLLDLR